jgi:hypothetical protein
VLENLLAQGNVLIFGGFVRDQIHNVVHGDARSSRDLDLVLQGKLGTVPIAGLRNNFGGHRHRIGEGLTVDYWELDQTYAFRQGLFKPRIENLPLTTVYTLNACFYDIAGGQLVEAKAIGDIYKKSIAFNCEAYLDKFPQYQAFRAMDLADRMGYQLDKKVRDFVQSQIAGSTTAAYVEAVQAHRPEAPTEQIVAMLKRYSALA